MFNFFVENCIEFFIGFFSIISIFFNLLMVFAGFRDFFERKTSPIINVTLFLFGGLNVFYTIYFLINS